MKKEDIIELTQDELVKQIVDDKELYAKLKFNNKVAELENPMKLNHMRKDIARLLTEERKRAMAETDVATEDKTEKASDTPKVDAKDAKKKTTDKPKKKAVEAKSKDEPKKVDKKQPKEALKEEPSKTDKKEEETKDK